MRCYDWLNIARKYESILYVLESLGGHILPNVVLLALPPLLLRCSAGQPFNYGTKGLRFGVREETPSSPISTRIQARLRLLCPGNPGERL